MTLGFRLDSSASSPYGFIVRLADQSRRSWNEIYNKIISHIQKKSKAIAWFVSHCNTYSKRELIAESLKVFFKFLIRKTLFLVLHSS